ncbi:MAG: trigger factor [Bdellovibrionales bacterium]|nr:trigger factor [Bdellovibrionales bacterium]
MKSNIETLSGLERKLSVDIPKDQVNSEFLNAFKYLQKQVEIKGFRKGKAPIDTIRSMYHDKVAGDVAQNLVQNAYFAALKEHDVIPVGMPNIDFQNPSENQDFTFTALFEVQPEVEVSNFTGLKVEQEQIEIKDEDVNKTIEQVLESHSKMEDVKLVREIQMGDFAQFDFKGFIDGEPLENGEAQGHVLELGSNSFIPGFEEGLVGLKPGDSKTLHLSFPEDYHVENLKGQKVQFQVTLHGIKKKVKPELNDEFVKGLGDFENVEAFKKQVRDDMEKNEQRRVDQDLKTDLFKALIAANPFEVPNALVKEQEGALIEDFRNRMQGQGFNEQDFAEYQQKWGTDFKDTADYMVRSALLIQKLAKDHNLDATEEDLQKKFQEFADQTGLDVAKVKEFYGKGNQASHLEFQITEDKVFSFLKGKADVKAITQEQAKVKKEAEAN